MFVCFFAENSIVKYRTSGKNVKNDFLQKLHLSNGEHEVKTSKMFCFLQKIHLSNGEHEGKNVKNVVCFFAENSFVK